ncbi:hypothetical protein CY35_06G083900 [Sphagnum magellanicum]|nr:hypothetical protein CY35_06G083900 [Sphagnum magellanicum]KAH9559991.1 hypothetical protein CY35_06G083900 [Sphagnum magellanicum]
MPQARGWNFGAFVKNLAEKSGGVLQAYQHDLQEFGIGLKKETAAVARLPLYLESAASVARVPSFTVESLETVGQVVEDFRSSVWRGTTEILAQVKEAVLSIDEEAATTTHSDALATPFSNAKYNRYESQVRAIQSDIGTYSDEPEDAYEYGAWLMSFSINSRKDEIDKILSSNALMQELQNQIVPLVVDYDMFWTRYFFHLHKLQEVENARANLVKRATVIEDEDLSWDVEEDKEEEEDREKQELKGASKAKESEITSVSDITTPILEGPEFRGSISTAPVDLSLALMAEDAHYEEEARSEGSTGSEWLVIPEEKLPESREPISSPICLPPEQIKRMNGHMGDGVSEDGAELDNISHF